MPAPGPKSREFREFLLTDAAGHAAVSASDAVLIALSPCRFPRTLLLPAAGRSVAWVEERRP